MNEYFACPACGNKAALKHRVAFAGRAQLYFGCTHCRHHFQVLRMDGFRDRIVAESPREVNMPRDPFGHLKLDNLTDQMGCPSCGRYGKIKMTTNRRDGYWRRHECPTDGAYYTCQTVHGISVQRKITSALAIGEEDDAA